MSAAIRLWQANGSSERSYDCLAEALPALVRTFGVVFEHPQLEYRESYPVTARRIRRRDCSTISRLIEVPRSAYSRCRPQRAEPCIAVRLRRSTGRLLEPRTRLVCTDSLSTPTAPPFLLWDRELRSFVGADRGRLGVSPATAAIRPNINSSATVTKLMSGILPFKKPCMTSRRSSWAFDILRKIDTMLVSRSTGSAIKNRAARNGETPRTLQN